MLYNTLDNKTGYVFKAKDAVKALCNIGYGEQIPINEINIHRAGDIMSSATHVYICVGECDDKSLVLLHSSQPGVQLSAMCTPEGNKKSQATLLVKRYMEANYFNWIKRYPNFERGKNYLTDYEMLKNDFLPDPEHLREMNADAILKMMVD